MVETRARLRQRIQGVHAGIRHAPTGTPVSTQIGSPTDSEKGGWARVASAFSLYDERRRPRPRRRPSTIREEATKSRGRELNPHAEFFSNHPLPPPPPESKSRHAGCSSFALNAKRLR